MLIGILQTGRAPDNLIPQFGDYPDMFADLLAGNGFTFQTWPVLDGVFPDSVTQADGWLITGSRHSVYEDHAFIPVLERFIRDARDVAVPLVGVCFGHQIIAQALGGKVEKFAGGWTVGPTEYSFGERTVVLNAWNQDQIVELPEGATITAVSKSCPIACCTYGNGILSFQAHPEFSAAFLTALSKVRGPGNVPQDLLDAIGTHRPPDADRASGTAEKIAGFFKSRHNT